MAVDYEFIVDLELELKGQRELSPSLVKIVVLVALAYALLFPDTLNTSDHLFIEHNGINTISIGPEMITQSAISVRLRTCMWFSHPFVEFFDNS